jgi:hypothetical protein
MRRTFKLRNTAATIVRDNSRMNGSLTDEAVSTVDRTIVRPQQWTTDHEALVVEGLISHDMWF